STILLVRVTPREIEITVTMMNVATEYCRMTFPRIRTAHSFRPHGPSGQTGLLQSHGAITTGTLVCCNAWVGGDLWSKSTDGGLSALISREPPSSTQLHPPGPRADAKMHPSQFHAARHRACSPDSGRSIGPRR